MYLWSEQALWVVAAGAKVQQATITTTIGQELMDLEKAYKEGLISKKEYNKQKKKILKRKQ